MKLAACYTVFNGLELLEKSINQIKDHVDLIVICYQDVSNKGNHKPEINRFMHALIDNIDGVCVCIEFFKPDLSKNTKENERIKHQQMINAAKDFGCTHFFLAATDHFYEEKQFIFGKNTAQVHDYDVTFTKMFTYYKHPTWQLTPLEAYYMPFIMKLKPNTEIKRMPSYPVVVDPSVQVNTISNHFYIFEETDLILHHFSMIREDIRDKFKNAAASIRWKPGDIEKFISEYENYDIEKNAGVYYFGGRTIKQVDNYFNL